MLIQRLLNQPLCGPTKDMGVWGSGELHINLFILYQRSVKGLRGAHSPVGATVYG